MPWIKRKNGKRYFFKYQNTSNGREKIYVGTEGSLEALVAYESEKKLKSQKKEKEEARQIINQLMSDFDEYHHISELLLRSYLLQSGYYKRKSEIRNIRSIHYES